MNKSTMKQKKKEEEPFHNLLFNKFHLMLHSEELIYVSVRVTGM